ncbi:MAG TPA: DUF5987 family protein [Pseudonocardiaceae bacterium]|nr:DUF5987 family protein [Pseudonocardiaceae bacterium]
MEPGTLDQDQIATLEAFADTIVPGEKRHPGDRAIAGAAEGPGAVEAGALALLNTPATGVTIGLPYLAAALNGHAINYADQHGITLDETVPAFVALGFADRTTLVRSLVAPGHPEKEGWVGLALFCNMSYDSAAHMHTVDAIAAGHPGLIAMGWKLPDPDGLWRFPNYGYGRKLADVHPNTTPSGSPA